MATNVITYSDFHSIAVNYGNIQTTLRNISGYLYGAVNTVAAISLIEPTYDLITDFYNSYTVNGTNMTTNVPLLAAVRKLNSHILNRGGYASINAFLADGAGRSVPQSWATLSEAAGQTISGEYISG
jgi:hypothetical protein